LKGFSKALDLPDAPTPSATVMDGAASGIHKRGDRQHHVADQASPGGLLCSTRHTRGDCRVHWHQLIISTAIFNAFENAGNLYTAAITTATETTEGDWFDRWINSAADWALEFDGLTQNPFLDDYVGHPMMGAITNDLWIQNDPRSMTVEQSNTWPYWRRMLRAGRIFHCVQFLSGSWDRLGEASLWPRRRSRRTIRQRNANKQRNGLGGAGDHARGRSTVDDGRGCAG
jgi:hypothetical protein